MAGKERAARLPAAATADEPSAHARIVRASAEVALERDWFAGTETAAELIAAADKEVPDGDWDTGFLRLGHTYARLLLVDGAPRIGPEGKDPYALAGLRDRGTGAARRRPGAGRRCTEG
ncbi:hypothetical protein [Streptomyces puniciscabiei]|uniref:hypothetical protein n=1 Tax=Streptomyces puniciscabiei TaxID=164348 RepID=UPI00332D36BD